MGRTRSHRTPRNRCSLTVGTPAAKNTSRKTFYKCSTDRMRSLETAETYRVIATIRRFEERLLGLKADGLIQGSMHLCSGQEAIPVGASRVLEERDALTVTYRGHGWAIARSVPVAHLFAELMGRRSPLNGGRG